MSANASHLRLENGLIAVARRFAPRLVPPEWQKPGDYPRPLPELAHALAGYGILVMTGDVTPDLAQQAALHYREWVENYKEFYNLLCPPLFPTFTALQAFYIAPEAPPIVGVQGTAIPLIEMMAGYVAPFVAARQGTTPSELELVGLMDIILEELEASDLPRDHYRHLRDTGAALIRQIMSGYTRQFPLTPPLRSVFGDPQPPPPMPPDVPERLKPTQPPAPSHATQTIPQPPPPIEPPTVLPEVDRVEDISPPPAHLPEAPAFDPNSVPIFYDPGKSGKRRPPVPDLPEE